MVVLVEERHLAVVGFTLIYGLLFVFENALYKAVVQLPFLE